MKTTLSFCILLGTATALAGCGSSDTKHPSASAGASSIGEAGSNGEGEAGSNSDGQAGKSAGSAGSSGKSGSGGAGKGPTAGEAGEAPTGEAGETSGGATSMGGATSVGGETSRAGETSRGGDTSGGGDSSSIGGNAGSAGSAPTVAWYQCQASDQAFVRRAILGVLGRRPSGLAEVNLYTDMIAQIDQLDGVDAEAPVTEPQTKLKHSRQVVLNSLYTSPDYETNWDPLYRDFVRVQRVEEQANGPCTSIRARKTDAPAAAAWVRDHDPLKGGDGKAAPTLADVIAGSIEMDDVSPIYTANLFEMITKTYDGANATPIALELSRRTDFGAWFDAAYLNRDTTCLGCHNSEFSVTFTANQETNRFFPVPGLFEKALFGGNSTGPATLADGYGAADREHAMLRYQQMQNINPAQDNTDCVAATTAQLTAATTAGTLPNCASGDSVYACKSDGLLYCKSVVTRTRLAQPWGMAAACGQFFLPSAIPTDQAGVIAQFGNISGMRASMWDVSASLRAGMTKLETDGLAADAHGEIADPDKAFAYLVSMNMAEKVWKEITGTPLTIANYFPRNAAARDTLQGLTDTLIKSHYSNKALLSAIFASPYLNVAPPETGCGTALYDMPRIFDPWRLAEPDPAAQGNNMTDGIQAVSSRTEARAAYGALGWPLAAYESNFPVYPKNPLAGGQTSTSGANSATSYAEPDVSFSAADALKFGAGSTGQFEDQFQVETGYYAKSSQPGFRGLDFQARLGWEDRFGTCSKLPMNTTPDVIDTLVQKAKVAGAGTIKDFVVVLKDRIMGDPTLDDAAEISQLQGMFGAPLEDDASTIPEFETSLRRVCGAFLATPQFLMLGLQPKDLDRGLVPTLTPTQYGYDSMCTQLAKVPLSDGLSVSCTAGSALTVNVATAGTP